MPKPAGIPPKRALPSKEATLFKELLTLYETRQLKKAQKTADQILKKFPEHGETLCMKGLVMTHMGKREEGMDLVKKGIRFDLTSHICWHVFGLIQKAEKRYEEALKSYMQALKFDKDNSNILRDAAHLQTQLRAFDGLVETRHAILRGRPNFRQHWIAMAVAYHLNGQLTEAKRTMEHYEAMLKEVARHDVEHSESLLYHVRILEDLEEIPQALAFLEANAKSGALVDRTAVMTFRARLLSKLEKPEAEKAWRALIERNPDCYEYYHGFLNQQGIDLRSLSDDTRPRALEILQDFSSTIAHATAPRRLALAVATGDDFTPLAKSYLVSALRKGIPSLFSEIKSLYADPQKQQVIEDLVEDFRSALAPDAVPTDPPSEFSPTTECPTTYLWTLYFLAQHHSFLSRPLRAQEVLSMALEHTPTLPELHACQGRILKRAGDFIGAARSMDQARLLDGQDRFLNTKCAKYQLRAGMIEEANELLGLFVKKDATSPGADLEDMQSLLYLIEDGDAHYRSGNLALALKRYTAIHKIFDEIEDDQFDFHGYSVRKFTVNIYLDLLTWSARLRSHPGYIVSALSASRIYVAVHDEPSLAAISSGEQTEAEKKAKQKAKKAARKVQQEEKKGVRNTANDDKSLEPAVAKDDDPIGLKLLSVTDPLEQAAKVLAPLATLAPKNIDVWIAIYDVAVRRKKFLQAAKALNCARALDAEHPELHVRIVDYQIIVSTLPQDVPDPMGPLVKETLATLLPDEVSPETFNSQYLQRNSTSPRAVFAAAKASQKLGTPQIQVEESTFTTLDLALNVKTALEIIQFLSKIRSPREDAFREACNRKFELSTTFKPPEELSALRKAVPVQEEVVDEEDKP